MNTNQLLTRLRSDLNRHMNKQQQAIAQVQKEEARLEVLESKLKKTVQAQEILQQIAQQVQQTALKQIGKVVSKCLSPVFEDPYQLVIDFVRLRGKTEARLVYTKRGHEVDPLRTSGGVLDVSALALRISELMLSTPSSRKLLVLDEPFKAVDKKNLPKVAAVLDTMSHKMGIQMIIVTHSEQLQVGKVIEL